MSATPAVRRTDKLMSEAQAEAMLAATYSGRLETVGADGQPYCVPLLYVWLDGEVFMHGTGARGHLRANVEHEPRACFEIDEPGEVFDYGRFECDSTVAYRSVILFGHVRLVEDVDVKARFCDALMAKYAKPERDRPRGFYPRLGLIAVYALKPERITGKELALPAVEQQWPAVDRSKTPNARIPT
jgi:nitroimidazol reductase NimA-like FMN-containing flavoprotein (pyridoxamine 5'-phosphate oxidase superfamily)